MCDNNTILVLKQEFLCDTWFPYIYIIGPIQAVAYL